MKTGVFKRLPKMIVATFKSFAEDKGMKLSASLAYYTVFSIGPLILLLITLSGIFLGEAAIEGKVFEELRGLLGQSAAAQLQEIIKNFHFSNKTNFALIASIITLIIGATTLFVEMQDSLNIIWKLKAKPKRGWVAFLKNRLISSSLIVSLGFLLIVSLIVNGVIQAMMNSLTSYFGFDFQLLVVGIDIFITFLIITTLFGIVFKFLPDAKIQWKHVRAGAIFTAVLFMIGRYLIGLYIQYSATASNYGAAGAIIVLLLWIYYSAVILYIGAEFTKVNAEARGEHIRPAEYAVQVKQEEIVIEEGDQTELTATGQKN